MKRDKLHSYRHRHSEAGIRLGFAISETSHTFNMYNIREGLATPSRRSLEAAVSDLSQATNTWEEKSAVDSFYTFVN